jgi:hypothetical protein
MLEGAIEAQKAIFGDDVTELTAFATLQARSELSGGSGLIERMDTSGVPVCRAEATGVQNPELTRSGRVVSVSCRRRCGCRATGGGGRHWPSAPRR